MQIWKTLWILSLAALVAMPAAAESAATAESEARKAADEWLTLVDGGDYGASWEAAAALFKAAVSKEDWEKSLTGVRPPFGAVVSRKFKEAEYATSLPGAPDGEYVVIQFETVFERKSEAVETVTPMKETDGSWRIAGYYIR